MTVHDAGSAASVLQVKAHENHGLRSQAEKTQQAQGESSSSLSSLDLDSRGGLVDTLA